MRGVRGSPLVHSLVLLMGLVMAGGVFFRLTGEEKGRKTGPERKEIVENPAKVRVPYRLILSAAAERIAVNSGPETSFPALSGTMDIDPGNAVVFLRIKWAKPPVAEESRFAKLILEWPGRSTITHVFDAPGDIDEVFEIPEIVKHD